MTENGSKTLVDEKLAVSLFLDSLLRDTEIEEAPQVASVTEIQDEHQVTDVEAESKQESIQESKLKDNAGDLVAPAEISPDPVAKSNDLAVNAVSEETAVSSVANELTHPAWANKPFQVLLFYVAGLKIAVPLVELCGVIKWKDSVTEMPGHADFYMGILQHLNRKIAVIDTAKMIIPKDKQEQLVEENPRERVHHIVMIDDYRWGLACDKIGEVITLKPEDVRWRKASSNRSWLAGTVIEHMCALLNSDGFSLMLEKG